MYNSPAQYEVDKKMQNYPITTLLIGKFCTIQYKILTIYVPMNSLYGVNCISSGSDNYDSEKSNPDFVEVCIESAAATSTVYNQVLKKK